MRATRHLRNDCSRLRFRHRQRWLSAACAVVLLGVGPVTASASERRDRVAPLRLATTTSPDHSGLLAWLLPDFQLETGIEVQVIAVGTGKALTLGAAGDVDAVLVHAPGKEAEFVDNGYGLERHQVMFNDFVLVGPQDNPAGVTADAPAARALVAVATTHSRFVSRGDDSGTHLKEKELWQTASYSPGGSWYLQSGRGMAGVLQMANELGAYTLTDRGTWIALRHNLPALEIVNQGDPRLHNPYVVIAVDPQHRPGVNHRAAAQFIDWLVSDATQDRIGQFTIDGAVLFYPARAEKR